MAIRVVIAGMGVRGSQWARELRRDGVFEIVACVDRDPGVLDRVARQDDLETFATIDEALEKKPCDGVIIATPPDEHEHACESAIAHGIPILVEKPFTLQLESAVRIVRAAEERAVPLLVAQNFRYLRVWRAVREVLAAGDIGEVSMVSCHYYRPPHHMVPSLARLEHSVLWGVGVHHLDVLRHVLGGPITGVMADNFTAARGSLPKGASMNVMLTFRGGARGVYTATYESTAHEYFEGGQEFYARFVGDRATLHVVHRWLFLCEGRKLPRPVRRGPRAVSEERILLQQFERAIRHGEPAECSGRDNLQTMAAIEACLRSSESGRWINPQELLP